MEANDVHKILLGGDFVAPKSRVTRPIINPANLDKLGLVADCGEDDVHAAVVAAKKAQHAWWKTPGIEKAGMLRQVAARIKGMQEEVALLLTKETGKPLCESKDCVDWVVSAFDYYAEVGRRAQGTSFPPSAPHQVNFTVKEPYGVVAAITPFNFPLLLLAWKVAPALAAGNAVVVKPPHQNPLSTLKLAEAFDVLPPGVVNVVTGDGPTTGEALIQHRDVDCIAFTGSTAVGRHIASVAGSHLKKVNLELGGIDPFIVFEDADLEVAVRGVAWARLLNAGQVCTSSKRIYLVKDIAAEFTKRIVDHVKTLRVGDPVHADTDIGPLISEEALLKVDAQVKKAVSEGATVLVGGKCLKREGLSGYFYEPTVLTNVRHGSSPTTDEIFGPVISIVVAEDADDAIAKANDSSYGLGANIYTNNLQYTMKAMENIKAGSFWVNDPLTDNNAAPFGGMRFSGVGRELGEEGLDAFREPKHVHIDYVMERKSYWFPYKDRN
jgi:acyl-CoA reductase-like NAD-dependent aldehyde dehydrogenase